MMKLFGRTIGQGQPLLILHGLFGSSDNWQTHAKKLSDHFQVHLVDQRNHGHSPQSHKMNYDVLAEDLYEFVAEHGLRDLLLIGHSMGGKTIMRFAQKYNFLIDKMVVADMGIRQYPSHHDAVFRGLFAVDVDNCPGRKEAEDRLIEHIGDAGTRQFLLKNLFWKEQGKLAWRFNLPVLFDQRQNLMAALPAERIEAHTLFLRGALSHYVADEDFIEIKKLALNAELDTIPNAGHWLHADAPGVFLEKAMSFFGA
jgi:pimeloyl-ACP methyl ester carboxylesterase